MEERDDGRGKGRDRYFTASFVNGVFLIRIGFVSYVKIVIG